MVAKIHFNIHVEDRTQITANKGEISMGMRIIPHVGSAKLGALQDLDQAILQQLGLKKGKQRLSLKVKVAP